MEGPESGVAAPKLRIVDRELLDPVEGEGDRGIGEIDCPVSFIDQSVRRIGIMEESLHAIDKLAAPEPAARVVVLTGRQVIDDVP